MRTKKDKLGLERLLWGSRSSCIASSIDIGSSRGGHGVQFQQARNRWCFVSMTEGVAVIRVVIVEDRLGN